MCVEQVDFARLMIANIDQDVVAGMCFSEMGIKAGIFLFVDEFVIFDGCAKRVAIDMQGAMIVVEAHVIESAAILRPNRAAASVRNNVIK